MSNKQQYEDDADENGTIRDKGRVVVKMMAMDSAAALHKPGYRTAAQVKDAVGTNVQARRAAYRDYENDLVNAYKRDDTLPITGAGTHNMRGSVGASPPYGAYPYKPEAVGSACSIDGWEGRLVETNINGEKWLVCKPTSSTDSDGDDDVRRKKIRRNARGQEESTEEVSRDQATLDQDREQAYRTYDEILASSWRTGK